jgi:hypothetical protein
MMKSGRGIGSIAELADWTAVHKWARVVEIQPLQNFKLFGESIQERPVWGMASLAYEEMSSILDDQ